MSPKSKTNIINLTKINLDIVPRFKNH